MQRVISIIRSACTFIAVPLVLAFAGQVASAADTYNGVNLTIPTMVIGSVTYSNVVVKISKLVSYSKTGPAAGSFDTYDPATGLLTVPQATYAGNTFYNSVVKVGSLVSIGGVAGADVYNVATSRLTVAAVQLGKTVYNDVVLSVSLPAVVSVAGGMPVAAIDQYTPSVGQLLIPAVQVGAAVYTNVTIKATTANIISIGPGGGSSSSSSSGGSSSGSSSSSSSGGSTSSSSSSSSSSSGGSTSSSSSSSSSGGSTSSGGAGFWAPFGEGVPTSSAVTGFGVLPSNLSSNTLTQVSTTGTEVDLGLIFSYSLGGANGVTLTPFAQLFAAKGADGNLHLYKSQLANSAAPPTPVQFSNLSLPVTDTICPYPDQGYAKITDPTTAFIGITVYTAADIAADANACTDGNPAGLTYLIHSSDSASTAPIAVTNIQLGTQITEAFDSTGAITGLIAFDTSQNLNFYPAVGGLPSLTSPRLLVAGVTDNHTYNQAVFLHSGSLLAGGSQSLISVNVTATTHNQLWRVTSSGTGSVVLDTTAGITATDVYDDSNFYVETTVTANPATYSYYAVPLVSGTATLLTSSPTEYTILDSDGSRLILTAFVISGTSFSDEVATLSISNAAAGFTTLESTSTGSISAWLDYASDQVFITIGTSTGISGEVRMATGQLKSALTPGTDYFSFAASGISRAGGKGTSILAVEGIPQGQTNQGGGTLYNVAVSTLARTPITLNGSPYVVPAGTSIAGVGFGNGIVEGLGYGTGGYFGFIADTSKNQMVTTAPSQTTTLSPVF